MKLLSLLILSSFLFACSAVPAPKVIEKEVYVRCPMPDVPKTPKPRVSDNATYPEKLKALLDYMFSLEKENEILREVLDTCRQ